MSGIGDPRTWVDRLVGASLGVLAAVVALNFAVGLARPMLPWLAGLLCLALVLMLLRARRRGDW